MSEALPADSPGVPGAVPRVGAGLEETPRVGRPRDPRVDTAVHAATLELLVESGYQATTVQAIAQRAGVSAPTVYRRWANKAEIVEESVFPSGLLAPETLTGDIISDLQPYCLLILRHLSSPAVRAAIPGLLTEYQTNPAMWQRVVERSVTPMRNGFAAFATRAGGRPVADLDAVFDVMLGALFTRALNVGAADAEEFARQVSLVVTTALDPDSVSRP